MQINKYYIKALDHITVLVPADEHFVVVIVHQKCVGVAPPEVILNPCVTLKFVVLAITFPLPPPKLPTAAFAAFPFPVLYPNPSMFFVMIDTTTFTTPVFVTRVTSRPSPWATNFVSKNCKLFCHYAIISSQPSLKKNQIVHSLKLTSGCVPVTQAINLCRMLLLIGRYM